MLGQELTRIYTETMNIFIVGPGGVGKSTAGKILAAKLGFTFIDLDQVFCERIENIRLYVRRFGYEKYCYTNSTLFFISSCLK
jgi:shikimate kinase